MLIGNSSIVFAQEVKTTSAPVFSGIDSTELRSLSESYLKTIFNKYINEPNLLISYVSCTDNRSVTAANDTPIVNAQVQANFTNFPLEGRIISGRLETNLNVRYVHKSVGSDYWAILDEDNPNLRVKLLIGDLLSDDLRKALIDNYMNQNYPNKMDLNIQERIESYGTKTYSYVSCVVNNSRIVFLRAIFEQASINKTVSDVFDIVETPWTLNRSEVVFDKPFPDPSIHEENLENDKERLENVLKKHCTKNTTKANFGKDSGLTKRNGIANISLVSATNGTIKLKMTINYDIDLTGLWNSYYTYELDVYPYYSFNLETGEWNYEGMDDIDTSKIETTHVP
jgi:hypothetical protein